MKNRNLTVRSSNGSIFVVTRTSDALASAINPTLESVNVWLRDYSLQLAHQKTETIILTKKWTYTDPQLTVRGHKKNLQYVAELYLDINLKFNKHLRTVPSKASSYSGASGTTCTAWGVTHDAGCLNCQRLEDTANHTLLDSPH
ncbi:Hypothetical protein CINCED_3A012496 [Cinara cedri]|uniref:Reverse transcriptase domain n=1 Tax=Cinara cedri TaxID=506608 RepID=A0A5E4M753_9HEMI|nr:Hypothetical protein CINCED_3A012496 [Cinara cedri]